MTGEIALDKGDDALGMTDGFTDGDKDGLSVGEVDRDTLLGMIDGFTDGALLTVEENRP